MTYDSAPETEAHIARVKELLEEVTADLNNLAYRHDESKLGPAEKPYFDEFTPKLKGSTYNSDEYQEHLKGLDKGLLHHYAVNDHHPEYFSDVLRENLSWKGSGEDGSDPPFTDVVVSDDVSLPIDCSDGVAISRMNLIQITEMLADWKAASERHANGDLQRSIDENQRRFGYSDELKVILHNTAKAMGW